jgi:hypothetical protein
MLTNPARLPDRLKSFDGPAGGKKLRCRVHPLQPRLNLGFRFQAGYVIEVPLRQYTGAGHRWSAVLRVTPETDEREPVWLLSRGRVPASPDKKATAEFSGGFLLGEGKYRVDMLLADDNDRVCVAHWNLNAKLTDEVREARPGLPAGAVDDISLRRWGRMPVANSPDEPRSKISVLVHAAAMSPNRVRLRGEDRMLLMSALASMLERLPVRSVRLSLFSMDRQSEIYRTDELSPASFRDVVDALNGLELGTVDYGTLKNRGGHVDLVSDLLQRELSTTDAPDAVVFLGPLAHWTDRVADEALPEREGSRPVYNIQLRMWRFRAPAFTDTIARAVRKLGGRTKEVYTPSDFAEAIRDVERLLDRKPAP